MIGPSGDRNRPTSVSFSRGQFSEERFEGTGGVRRSLDFCIDIFELQTYSSQHFLVVEESVHEFLPVLDLTMIKHELQGDVFEKEVLGDTQDRGEAFFLLGGHRR